MNKKIVSFVLAMVLSVGLGVGSLFAGNDNYNASGGNKSNSSVLRSSGTASGLNPSASALANRVSQVFHYESGILVSATGADGSVTVYDQGKYRGTMSMGQDGSYAWSNLAFYASDFDTIAKAGGMDTFLLSIGVKPEQLKGGGEEGISYSAAGLTEEDIARLKKDGYTVTASTGGTYYAYKYKLDGEWVTKIISEEEYKGLSEKEQKNCTVSKDKIYTVKRDKKEAETVKWLDSALDHLSKGQNYSISIDFGGSQGATVTFSIDGKARQTFAWDNVLTTQYEYTIGGMTTFSLKKGVDLAESLKTGKAQTEDKWVATVTIGGKVKGVFDATKDGEVFTVTGGTSQMKYEYNADGSIRSVFDAETSQTTHYVAGKVTSVTGPIRDANGNVVNQYTDENGKRITESDYDKLSEDKQKKCTVTPKYGAIATYKYYDNGLINTVESEGADGSITTSVYLNNECIGSYRGNSHDADAVRANIVQMFDMVANPEKYPNILNGKEAVQIDPRITAVYWSPELLAKIYNGGNWDKDRLAMYIRVRGWDKDGISDADKGTTVEEYAKGLIETAMQNTNWLSQGMVSSYADTAYSQDDIDTVATSTTTKKTTPTTRLPATKYVASDTVYNHGVAYATYNSQNLDPSVSRAYYLYFQQTFNTDNETIQQICKELGIDPKNISDTMGWAAFEKLIDKISDKITEMINDFLDKYTVTEGTNTSVDTDKLLHDLGVDTKTWTVGESTWGVSAGRKTESKTETKESTTTTTRTRTYNFDKVLDKILEKIGVKGMFTKSFIKSGKFASLSAEFKDVVVDQTIRTSSTVATNKNLKDDVNRSTNTSSNRKEAWKSFAEGIYSAFQSLRDSYTAYFSNIKANIVSGKLGQLQSAMGLGVESVPQVTGEATTTNQTHIHTTHFRNTDPAVVGNVSEVVIMDADGNVISEEDYNNLSEAEKAQYKKYALLTDVEVNIDGYGFKSGKKETMYVEIDDETYNDFKLKLNNGEKISYGAAGYIGQDINGMCVLVDTYASSVGTDIESLKTSFEQVLANNDEFKANMEANREAFAKRYGLEKWTKEASESIAMDWADGWAFLQRTGQGDVVANEEKTKRYLANSENPNLPINF